MRDLLHYQRGGSAAVLRGCASPRTAGLKMTRRGERGARRCLPLRHAESTFALPVPRRRDSLDADLIHDTCHIHP